MLHRRLNHFGHTQQELLERLNLVLTRLRDYGLKVKPSKCVLFRTEIKFLGHLVSSSGIQPLPDKVQAIKDWPVPRCIRDVRAYYGLVGYYRRFIPNFATIAEPLTHLKPTDRVSSLNNRCLMHQYWRFLTLTAHAFWIPTQVMWLMEPC